MPISTTAQERVVLAFLERSLADRERGRLLPLAEYQRMFPGADARIAAEYGELAAAPADEAAPAETRVGSYRLLRLLGRGGQGEVYEAWDERLGRVVALKLLPRAFGAAGEDLPPAIAREWEALSRLDHPGICVAHDAGQADGRAYLAMRLVRGFPIDRHLEGVPRGAERVRAATALIAKAARALQAAHEAGVIHRDLKPSNILVNEQGDPVVLDFGLARAEQAGVPSFTLTGDLIGTPRYLAPERLRGEGRADPRGDVWSLGVTLHQALTGAPPFDGVSFASIARAVTHDEPADPRTREPAVSRDLSAVVATALEKDPARRYASMEAFAADLERTLRGEPVLARTPTARERTVRWIRHHPAPAAFLLLLVCSLVAALTVAREFRSLAARNAATLRVAEANLSLARLEEARLLLATERHDRAERVLELVTEAATARRNAHAPDGAAPEDAAPLAELRSLALDALLMPAARLLAVHPRTDPALASFSRDGVWVGERIVGAGEDRVLVREIRLRRSADGAIVARSSHPDLLDAEEGLAVSSDGRTIAVIGPSERSALVWDLFEDRLVQELALPEDLCVERRGRATRRRWLLHFDAQARHLAAAVAPLESYATEPTPRGFALWRLADGERLAGGATGTYRYPWLHFSADGAWCLVARDEKQATVLSLDADGAHEAHVLNLPLPIWGGAVTGGSTPRVLLAVGAAPAPPHSWWILPIGATSTERALEFDGAIEAANCVGVAMAPGETRFAFADRASGMRVVDLERGAEVLRVAGAHPANLDALSWNAEGTRLLSHGRNGDLRIWEPIPDFGRSESHEIPHGADPGGLFGAAADASLFVYTHPRESHTVWAWDPSAVRESWRRFEAPAPSAPGMAVYQLLVERQRGRVIRVASHAVTSWDLAGGGTQELAAPDGGECLAIALDADGGARVLLRDAAGYRMQPFAGGDSERWEGVERAAWAECSDDGLRLLREAIPGSACALEIFERSAAAPVCLVREDPARTTGTVRGFHFTRCGRWVGAWEFDADQRFTLWDARTGARVFSAPVTGDPNWYGWDSSPALGLVAYCDGAGRVVVLDPERSEPYGSWDAEAGQGAWLRFLDDGRLLTRADAGPARIWDLAAMRRQLAELGLDEDGSSSPAHAQNR